MRRLIFFCLMGIQVWAQPSSLGLEYQELRKVRGHFTGGGAWNDEVDHWKGRKHQVMSELGQQLGQADTARLLATMGEPDAREGQQWIYYWRGRHDYLFFVVDGSRVLRSQWWMAGE